MEKSTAFRSSSSSSKTGRRLFLLALSSRTILIHTPSCSGGGADRPGSGKTCLHFSRHAVCASAQSTARCSVAVQRWSGRCCFFLLLPLDTLALSLCAVPSGFRQSCTGRCIGLAAALHLQPSKHLCLGTECVCILHLLSRMLCTSAWLGQRVSASSSIRWCMANIKGK